MTDLAKYYAQICKEPILKKEEEFDLFMLLEDEGLPIKEREAIRDRIIRANLRFVFKQAKKYSRNDPEIFEELIGAGNEGLLVGLEKYNPSRNVRFLSYAGWWVGQRILKEMSQRRIVALPIWKQQLAARILRANENREKDLTLAELKNEFPDVPEKDLVELYHTRYLTYYLEDMSDSDPSLEIDPITTEVEARIDGDRVNAAVAKLPQPHRELIELLFGLHSGEELTISAIAKQMKLSKESIKVFKREALEMLQDELGEFGTP